MCAKVLKVFYFYNRLEIIESYENNKEKEKHNLRTLI